MSNPKDEYKRISSLPPEEWTEEAGDRLVELLELAQDDEELAAEINRIDEQLMNLSEEEQEKAREIGRRVLALFPLIDALVEIEFRGSLN